MDIEEAVESYKKDRRARKRKNKKALQEHMRQIRSKIDYEKRKPPSEWKPRGPRITKKRFVQALDGTCGVMVRIAENLDVTYPALRRWMNARPDRDELEQLIEAEADRLVDTAKNTVLEMMEQREELGVAFQASKFVLIARAGWKNRNETREVKGGVPNIQIGTIQVDNLSLDLRRRLLAEFDSKTEDVGPGVIEGEVVSSKVIAG